MHTTSRLSLLPLICAAVSAVLGSPSLVSASSAAGGISTRPGSTEDLERLLARIFQPVPNRFHFKANVTVWLPAWTEREVEKELRAQERIMRDHDKHLSPGDRKEVEQKRREVIRQAHSGTNTYDIEMWVSGELYRKDESWTSIPNSSRRSYVHLGEPRFTNVLSFITNFDVESATVFTNLNSPEPVDRLWNGFAIEPVLVPPAIMSFARVRTLPPRTEIPPLREFGGFDVVLDPVASRQLLEGKHPNFTLAIDDVDLAGTPIRRFRLEAKHSTRGFKNLVTYWLDARDNRKLHRVEFREPGGPLLVSTRSDHDETGWPRLWTTQETDADGKIVTKRVEIVGGIDDDFDDATVFSAVFPKHYLVSVSSGSGVGELVQNPRGSKVMDATAHPAPRSARSQFLPLFTCAVLITVPILLARALRTRRNT